jgi:hypothetical protein
MASSVIKNIFNFRGCAEICCFEVKGRKSCGRLYKEHETNHTLAEAITSKKKHQSYQTSNVTEEPMHTALLGKTSDLPKNPLLQRN